MSRDAIVAGTGFANSNGASRAAIVRRHCRPGDSVLLVREPNNPHDKDAIAVFVPVPRLFGLLGSSNAQIGYIKAGTADSLAKKLDSGVRVVATVKSMYAPEGREHPRVTLHLEY